MPLVRIDIRKHPDPQFGRKIGADDLQAIMWFAEKREWRNRGWAQIEDLGDFRQYSYKMQPQNDGTFLLKDVVLNSTSIDFLKSLSGVQVEGAKLMSLDNKAAKKIGKLQEKLAEISENLAQIPEKERGKKWVKQYSDTAKKVLALNAGREKKYSTSDYRE